MNSPKKKPKKSKYYTPEELAKRAKEIGLTEKDISNSVEARRAGPTAKPPRSVD